MKPSASLTPSIGVQPAPARGRLRPVAGLLVVVLLALGCSYELPWVRQDPEAEVDPFAPVAQRIEAANLEVNLRGVELQYADRAKLIKLYHLAKVFYRRLAHRRINSIATFHDPALREFFRDPEAFADFYADLVNALAEGHFEQNRPTDVGVVDIEVEPEGTQVRIHVRFVGENSLPLRPWRVRYIREDAWEYADDRWWIIPGKV